MIAEDLARLAAAGRHAPRAVDYYITIGSTMQAAVGRASGTVIIAEEQTAGQGRHGHSWHSEWGTGIYFSMVLKPAPLLTLALGLATAETITSITGLACDLRWPNDVMIGGKKAAGILVQLVEGNAIGGIGINVNHTSFPPELAQEAASLRLEAGCDFDRMDILLALIPAIESFADRDSETILRLFTQASSYAVGRRVRVEQADGIILGITTGLDPSGYLKIRTDDGTDTLILAGGVRAASS
jgi:BirA family biotin operon repressor/biotin-[acetyl-CoA-carboxylase] ligase